MAHILTDDEAIGILRISLKTDSPTFEMDLSGVDDDIKNATGYECETSEAADATAKVAAKILLICTVTGNPLPNSYGYKIGQLDAKIKNGEVT